MFPTSSHWQASRRWASPAISFVCILALGFPSPTPAQPLLQKRPLKHSDYDSWRSIQGQQLSSDGKFLAYALVPQEGDGELVVRNLATGAEWRHPLGSRPTSRPDQPAAGAPRVGRGSAPPQGARLHFTADSRFVVFTINPSKASVDQAKKAKKKPEEMPKNALGILEVATGQAVRVERVKSFQTPEEGAGSLAFLKEPVPEARPEDKKPDRSPLTNPPAKKPRGKKKEFGSDLVLRNLADRTERTIPDVLDYSFSKDGKTLVYAVSSKKEETNGVFALTPGTAGPPSALLTGRGRYTRLTWDDKQSRLAFLGAADQTATDSLRFKLYCWQRQATLAGGWPHRVGVLPIGPPVFSLDLLLGLILPTFQTVPTARAVELISQGAPGFRPGWVISEKHALHFSLDGTRLFFGTGPAPEPEKDETKAPPADDKVLVDLWHWKDDYIQPMQRVRAEQDKNRSFSAVYHFKEKKFRQLADETLTQVQPADQGAWALGFDDRLHRRLVDYDTRYADYYLVHTGDGTRKLLRRKQQEQWGMSGSPGGKFALFYDGKHWNSVAAADGKVVNLSGKLGVSLGVEDYDMPSISPAYGAPGWTTDDQHVLLYDRYDIWLVAPDGSGTRNLTQGLGRKERIQFRYLRLDPKEKAIDPNQPLLLRAENERTRDTGFYRVRLDGSPPENLMMAARNFGNPIRAKHADVLALTASTFDEFPDLLVTRSDFKELKKVSTANPQKEGLLWGKAEMVRFKNSDGAPLSGVLVKPENFDPAKKYPMLVYIYERLSQNLHHFVDPRPGHSINVSYYASNGYLVFMPDIVYTVGYPGQSALKCVLPGIQAMVDRGYVDEKAIGIQGHSWGGYQISYLITQTNRFKAAAAGAPVANMTSAYDGIRWGPGLPRQFQYERSQSRIGGTLWQYPMRFVENSPLFMADRVQTPLMMLHNDQDDAVPWYQGIEYFLALRRLDKEVYLFNYNGEPHGLRKRPNQKDYTRRLQEFFDYQLKGAPKPAWMAKGIPYLQREKEKEQYKGPTPARVGG